MIRKFSCETCENRLCTKNIPLFKSLSDNNLEKITKLKKHIHFEKGDFLFSEGDELTKLYIINSGMVKLTKTTVDGKERIIDLLGNGDFCGESNVLSNSVNSINNAIAIKDTDVCIIEKQELDILIRDNIEIAIGLLDGVNKKLLSVQKLASNLFSNSPDVRIASTLLEFSERYGEISGADIIVNPPINREEMASFCGIARETLSRKLSSFEKQGFIRLQAKKIVILNKKALEELI